MDESDKHYAERKKLDPKSSYNMIQFIWSFKIELIYSNKTFISGYVWVEGATID